jgi:8-oxo-dGTP pyrophosphatase MutT (NUDIX family)
MTPERLGPPETHELPAWLQQLATAGEQVRPEDLSRFLPPDDGGRQSAVLILFGPNDATPSADAVAGEPPGDVLLIERAHDMRSHPRQVAFPGGAIDPGDASPVAAALREAEEETGLVPSGVQVLGELPALFLPPSGFVVTPVLAWWHTPSPVAVVDPREVASVHRVPIAELVDPAHRLQVTHPSGYVGAAFRVRGLLVWGFTAGLLDRVMAIAGWERPWDRSRVEPVPAELLAPARVRR